MIEIAAQLLKGAPIAAALDGETAALCQSLREKNIIPTLAIIRLGSRADDLSYERGAKKRCAGVGIDVRVFALDENAPLSELTALIEKLNADRGVHGILLMRPLPGHIDENAVRNAISPEKDVDCASDLALGNVCTGADGPGFAPCTAQAVLELLRRGFGKSLSGRKVVVVGRSGVVGLPASMLLLRENATVTICHSKTENLASLCREADIVVAACGKTDSLGGEYFSPGQTVIDVGIGWSEEKQKLCGDVKTDEALEIVEAITPVPGGVGAVTAAVLASHVAKAALAARK